MDLPIPSNPCSHTHGIPKLVKSVVFELKSELTHKGKARPGKDLVPQLRKLGVCKHTAITIKTQAEPSYETVAKILDQLMESRLSIRSIMISQQRGKP
jgi:hypothetical protein